MITWADARSADIATGIRASSRAESLYRTTGAPISSMLPLCKIIWLKENKPDLFSRTYKFISIKEFIWYKLFREYKVDHSIACGTGLFNITTLTWDAYALQLAGITTQQLSDPVTTSYLRHSAVEQSTISGLMADSKFFIGSSDGCLANLGTLAINPGVAAITIGTSGAVRVSSNRPVYNFKAMTFNYILDETSFVCGGPVNNGGIAVEWFVKKIGNKETPSSQEYTTFFNEAEAVKAGSQGLIFLPYITGERAPVWDAKSCGVFFGISTAHKHATFFRAVLEGVSFSLNEILNIIETSTETITQVNVSGGFIHSKTWMQILADITGKKLCIIQTEDASAIGAALLSMKALHVITDYNSLLKNKKVSSVEPDMASHEKYKKYFAVFSQLYYNLREPMHALYRINEEESG
jgi:gluconokinase